MHGNLKLTISSQEMAGQVNGGWWMSVYTCICVRPGTAISQNYKCNKFVSCICNTLLTGEHMSSGLVLWWCNRKTAWLLGCTRFINKDQLFEKQSYNKIFTITMCTSYSVLNTINPSNPLKSLPQSLTYFEKATTNCKNWWNWLKEPSSLNETWLLMSVRA